MARIDQRSSSPLVATSPRVLVLAACGPQANPPYSDASANNNAAGATPAPAPAPVPGTRYQASGLVLEKDGRGAQLCLGSVASSLPPQCSGLPIVGWDWNRVEGEQTAQTSTWGQYHLVGTFDGERFTHPTGGERQDMQQIVLNVAFTGDLERHTRDLRKHWGGALCVVQHARTEAERSPGRSELTPEPEFPL